LSACTYLPGDAPDSCLENCIKARGEGLGVIAQREQADCESRYVAANGRGKFACTFSGVADLSPKQVDAALKAAMADTKSARDAQDGDAMDAAYLKVESAALAGTKSACTKACNERGPNLIAARAQAPGLVLSYKRCMVAADSTPEARKLDAYEVDLYCDYLHKADARCRAANRCDWVEQFSTSTCTYVSPGVGRCR
jgi:hypothetical protein